MVVFDLDAHLGACAREVDAHLRALREGDPPWPPRLADAMAHGTRGGKRLRAALTLAGSEAVGGEPPPIGAACAVELVHCYSLVHDDLPSMDAADARRGEPTVHRAFGEGIAVLAGDALLALAFEALAREGMERGRADAYLAAVREIGVASGPRGMVGGQTLDLAQKAAPPRTLRELEACHAGKTAALFAAAAAVGALCGGGAPEAVQTLRGFGFDLGLAFQHADDLADGEHAAFGADARRRAKELCARAARTAERFGERGRPLAALAERVARLAGRPTAQ